MRKRGQQIEGPGRVGRGHLRPVLAHERGPGLVGLGAMTDNDSLGQRLVGYYTDFELSQE